jgi:uncharacterized surface anchored protein
MNKKWLLTLVVAIICFFGININSTTVRATTNWGNQFITSVDLCDADDNAQTTFGLYDNMKVRWNFNIPITKNVTAGDAMTFELPSSLKLVSNGKFNVTDGRGNTIGKVEASKRTNKVKVILTEYVEKYVGGVKGQLSVRAQWNYSQVNQGQLEFLNWGHGHSSKIKIKPNGGPDPNEVLYKWSWYDANDPSILHWRVRVNYAHRNIDRASYTELIGAHQKLVADSIAIFRVRFDDAGKDFKVTATCPKAKVMTNGKRGFAAALGTINQTYLIDYQTRISSERTNQRYRNSGTLAANNIAPRSTNTYAPENKGVGTGQGWQNDTGKLNSTKAVKSGYVQKDNTVLLTEERQTIIKNFLMVGASLLALIGWFIYRRRK